MFFSGFQVWWLCNFKIQRAITFKINSYNQADEIITLISGLKIPVKNSLQFSR